MSIRLRRRFPSGSRFPIGLVLVAATFAFVFSLVGPSARAFPTGQVGHSGSPDTGAATCANCHQGADEAASVRFDAPTSMRVGETTTVTITLRGGPGTVAGFNAAAADGAGILVAAGPGAQLAQGEVTHVAPLSFGGEQAVFTFDWTAPDAASTVTWYVAAVSGNGDSATTGDAVATAQLNVEVLPQPSPTPTVGAVAVAPTTTAATASEAAAETSADDEADMTQAAASSGPFGFGLSPTARADATEPAVGLAATGAHAVASGSVAVLLFGTGAAAVVAGRRRQR